jgi:hypothetical protein
MGNQTCGDANAVKRCYEITPSVAGAATLRFYYTAAEANGNAAPKAYEWDGNVWVELPSATGGSGDALYVDASSVDISTKTKFALKDSQPSAATPTATTQPGPTPTATQGPPGGSGKLYMPIMIKGGGTAPPQPTPTPQPTPGGGDVNSGFDPKVNGFSFENYGNQNRTNLTPVEMQRMFGNAVCANTAGGDCALTPAAKAWMDKQNNDMDGGHCEGFAVLSNLMYYGQSDPNNFGASTTNGLAIENNTLLQREIAYWFVTQATVPGSETVINASPKAVVDTLLQALALGKNANEWYVIGIYKYVNGKLTAGHAITPIGVLNKGNGVYHIAVYDNNYPNETRYVIVNTINNTWEYEAAINPQVQSELYKGDASTKSLEVVTISPRLTTQQCHFCQTAALGPQAEQFYEISMDGTADLLIVDENGKRIGTVNGQFVNEISGASAKPIRLIDIFNSDLEPVYKVPVSTSFEVILDASQLTQPVTASVSIIGPGYVFEVEDVWLEAGATDSILFDTLNGKYHISYLTDSNETPEVLVGLETTGADFAFLARAAELQGAGDTFDLTLDPTAGTFNIDTTNNTEQGIYDYLVLRLDDTGEYVFGDLDYPLDPGGVMYLKYADWQIDSTTMEADIDTDDDGVTDITIQLTDETDTFYE